MRRSYRMLLQGFSAALALTGPAAAQDIEPVVGRARLIGPPCNNCPPVTAPIWQAVPPTYTPITPKVDPKQPDPKQPDPMQQPAPAPTEEASAFGLSGSEVAVSMFGNQFGRSTPIFLPQGTIVIPGALGAPVTTARSFLIRDGSNPNSAAILTAVPPNQLTINSLTVLGTQLGNQTFQTSNDLTNQPRTAQLLENAAVSNALRTANPGVTIIYVNGDATLVSAGPTPALYQAGPLNYNFVTQTRAPDQVINRAPIVFLLPNAGGGTVGRTPVSEGNSPLPRDRMIFDFDYFDSVPIGRGTDVRRFSPGFEKTFFNQRASIEVRAPFASTLSSTVTADGVTNTDTQFGNVNLTFKGLLYRSSSVAVAGGIGVGLPTGNDIHVRLADGTGVLRIDNESVILTPYLATLFTPNDRLFAQAWAQCSFDPNGNPVTTDAAFFGRGGNIGHLRDSTLLALDTQIGYWIYRSEGRLRGLAPFVELHYNGAIGNGALLNAGQGVFVGDQGGNFDSLDMTVGVIAQLGNRMNLSVGAVAPLLTGNDRTFDYQVGVRLNWLFGPSARSGSSGSAAISGF